MNVLVTGAGGLIGYEACKLFIEGGARVVGIDPDLRGQLFGKAGSVMPNIAALAESGDAFQYVNLDYDVRDREALLRAFAYFGPFDAVVHTAAQPAHDYGERDPFLTYDVNVTGTMNVLEATRLHSPGAVFVFLSSVKVCGEDINRIVYEDGKRYNCLAHPIAPGVSFFGITEEARASGAHNMLGMTKVAAEALVQEYHDYFGLATCILRPGCVTGSHHAAVAAHGFLAYLVECAVTGKHYTVDGNGKQVRDQVHGRDVARAIWQFCQDPRPGEVYCIGGGLDNSLSVLEAIDMLKDRYGLQLEYDFGPWRKADHLVVVMDTSKLERDYPQWKPGCLALDEIIEELVNDRRARV